MWNRPALMNGVAGALYAVAALLALAIAWKVAARQPLFELREVTVGGALAHVTRGEIEGLVQRELRGNFLTLDLAAVSASFQKLPWVRNASVRRQWPARLEVALEEHVPLARWGSRALVNTQGEVFRATYDGQLPVFVGPEGAAREMAIQYRYFRTSFETIGQSPVRVEVSPRRAWKRRVARCPGAMPAASLLRLPRRRFPVRASSLRPAHRPGAWRRPAFAAAAAAFA